MWQKAGLILWTLASLLLTSAVPASGQLPPVVGDELAHSIEGTWYMVVARHGDKCLDVPDGDLRELAHVQQFLWHNGDNQFWRFERRVVDAGIAYYSITNMRSSLSLDVSGASVDDMVNRPGFPGGWIP